MTENQKQLIDSLTEEFNRISIQETKKKKFNLIDAKSLTDEKKEREYWEKISKDNEIIVGSDSSTSTSHQTCSIL